MVNVPTKSSCQCINKLCLPLSFVGHLSSGKLLTCLEFQKTNLSLTKGENEGTGVISCFLIAVIFCWIHMDGKNAEMSMLC